jgi:YgiT-type zinc finger domain-containing protein
MKCVICRHGETAPGKVTVSLTKGETTLVFKGVPADVCENCSEYFLSEEVTSKLLELCKEAVAKGAEIEVLRYAA